MTKPERRELLMKMLEANDKMSEERPSYILTYATCLLSLSDSKETNHASAIHSYEWERENAEYTSEQYYSYIADLEQPDEHSNKLLRVMEAQEKLSKSLYDVSEEGYNYFAGIYKEEIDFPDIEV